MINSTRESPSRRSNLIYIISVPLVFVFIFFLSKNAEKALASSVVFGVLLTIIHTKAENRKESLRDWRFWLIIGVLAVIHIVALVIIKFPELQAGLISLPFALVDAFVIWALINWIEKRFPGSRGSGPGKP